MAGDQLLRRRIRTGHFGKLFHVKNEKIVKRGFDVAVKHKLSQIIMRRPRRNTKEIELPVENLDFSPDR
jgi:hypothetical protein